MTDYLTNCSYNAEAKDRFHATVKAQLRKLADALGLERGTYDLRSNRGGIAVSGEITLHAESIYVQVNQSCMGPNNSILIRSCEGRQDYTGGINNFASISMLDDPGALAQLVSRHMRIDEAA